MLGSEAQASALLAPYFEADAHGRFGAAAWSEAKPCSERAGFTTTAAPDGSGWSLSMEALHEARWVVALLGNAVVAYTWLCVGCGRRRAPPFPCVHAAAGRSRQPAAPWPHPWRDASSPRTRGTSRYMHELMDDDDMSVK